MSTVQRRQHPVDVSKENGGARLQQQQIPDVMQSRGVKMSSRTDSPIVTGAARIIPSRYRQTPQSLLRSSSTSNPGYTSVSAATKLLQEVTGTPINPCAVSSGDGAIVHKKLSRVSASNAVDGCAAAASESTSCPNSPVCTQRKQQQIKVPKENGGTRAHQQQLADALQSKSSKISSRLDTPTMTGASRVVPSRYKFTPQSLHRHCPTNNPGAAVSAADKLFREVTATPINPCAVSQDDGALISRKLSKVSTSPYVDSCATGTATNKGSSCPSSPLCIQNNKTRTLSAMRSSMSEIDRCLTERNRDNNSSSIDDCSSYKSASSTCARSLHLPTASNENSSSWLSLKQNDMSASIPSRSSFKMGSICLPPHPTSNKLGPDARKGKKGFSDQGDVHSLKLLYSHYLQWRFANAKAEASMHSQREESQSKLYSFAHQLSDLRKSVNQKRTELGFLRRIKTLSTILESQSSCLEEWAKLYEDYSTSLSGTTDALRNCSLRLPVGAEVHVDIRELGDALSSSTKVMEMIGLQIQNFMQKAEETESLISELARVSGGEKALVEECGDLLLKTYISQVTEWSLRGQMIQMHQNNLYQVQEE
ncbi:protein ENDOSPERM DEFECTIVE 1-like [Solanum dulcamara]|uniref:protein ENDOSPERM DEFECTIVE 1-like n=1 Tax=Solanum dulcamara TaxID=45834 RepID=UPI00248565C2|nr:protein ENDOSPERM DEFECTIVE 1-like [Solanum dulcamara]